MDAFSPAATFGADTGLISISRYQEGYFEVADPTLSGRDRMV
jgi:hypothetical protein